MVFRIPRALKDYLLAFSISNLLLVQAWFSILYDRDRGYFNHLRVTPAVLLALFSSLVLLAFPLRVAIRLWRCSSAYGFRVAMAIMAMVLLVPPLNFIRVYLAQISAAALYRWGATPWCPLFALSALAIVILRPALVATIGKVIAVSLFPLAVLNVVRIVLVILGVIVIQQHAAAPALASRLPISSPVARVVWVIFDELDQRVTFEDRPMHVGLQNLDRFRKNSLACTQAFPPANGTMLSLPALHTGRMVCTANPKNASDLNLSFAPDGAPERWSQQSNLLSIARAAGINCGVVAWYHPYDRLFASDLTDCFCGPLPHCEQARGSTFLDSMSIQLLSMASPLLQRRLAIRLHKESTGHACRMVSDPSLGLVFLHLQGPHRPGIYNPRSGKYTWWNYSIAKEYLDNLALTDVTLGRLQASMAKAGLWESSWVIISADHCWRESKSLDGKFDLRVPFMIKPPGPAWGGRFDKKMNTVLSRDLILSMLSGELKGGEDIAGWLDRHRSEVDPVGGPTSPLN